MLKYYDMWHYRLSNVNYNSIQKLINHELLPSMVFKKNHKCRICVESKFSKPLFQTIKKISEPLDLIHLDIDYLKFMKIRGRKKYYITFINDCIRYYYI